MVKGVVFSIRVPPDLARDLEGIAKATGRSRNALIVEGCLGVVARRGGVLLNSAAVAKPEASQVTGYEPRADYEPDGDWGW